MTRNIYRGKIKVAEFDESKHPRDEQGKFTDKNKTSASRRNETLANALNTYTNTHKNPSVTKKRMALMVRCYCRYKTRNVCA